MALKAKTRDPLVFFLRGSAYSKLKNKDAMLKDLKQFQKLDADSFSLRNFLKSLDLIQAAFPAAN
jgi:hypothetical protein